MYININIDICVYIYTLPRIPACCTDSSHVDITLWPPLIVRLMLDVLVKGPDARSLTGSVTVVPVAVALTDHLDGTVAVPHARWQYLWNGSGPLRLGILTDASRARESRKLHTLLALIRSSLCHSGS